ncbi:hypothetical protein GCM10028811_08830 [Uliginosibacterium sediminicola]
MAPESIVAGIDVGGPRKGYHLAILRQRQILAVVNSTDPQQILRQCLDAGVSAIAIDAPSQWTSNAASHRTIRSAERALLQAGIHCFFTPTRERAAANQSGFYEWMFQGEALYQALAAHYPPARQTQPSTPFCCETFPHAITHQALGSETRARLKRSQRSQLLQAIGLADPQLDSIDTLDATLCALSAQAILQGASQAYGEAEDGFIFVPQREFWGTT